MTKHAAKRLKDIVEHITREHLGVPRASVRADVFDTVIEVHVIAVLGAIDAARVDTLLNQYARIVVLFEIPSLVILEYAGSREQVAYVDAKRESELTLC